VALAVLVAALALGPARAPADAYRYNDVVVGERAAGMGGAFTALADDGSAPYYNPAGLALLEESHVSISGSGWQIRRETVKGYLGGSGIDQLSNSIIPSASGGVSPFWGGRAALAIVVPEFEDYAVDWVPGPEQLGSGLKQAHIVRQKKNHTYLVGLAYGTKVADNFSLGGTAFFHYRSSLVHREDWYLASAPDAQGWTGRQVVSDISQEVTALRLFGGMLWHPRGPEGNLHLGLSIRFNASASVTTASRAVEFRTQDPAGVAGFERVADDCKVTGGCVPTSDDAIPSAIAAGVAWSPFDWATVSADATYFSSVVVNGLVSRKAVLNWAAGGEARLRESWTLRAGAFSNYSSAPDLSGGNALQPDRVNEHGVSAAVGWGDGPTTTTCGIRFSAGAGRTTAVTPAGETVQRDVDAYQVTLFLGGTYRF
jgi:long-chain fatty acid transport protein